MTHNDFHWEPNIIKQIIVYNGYDIIIRDKLLTRKTSKSFFHKIYQLKRKMAKSQLFNLWTLWFFSVEHQLQHMFYNKRKLGKCERN